jgi:hypothetical protein
VISDRVIWAGYWAAIVTLAGFEQWPAVALLLGGAAIGRLTRN